MKQLSSFSIETDHMVQLVFADGSQYRVKKPDLSSLLSQPDLKKVMAAFKTRKKFLNETLPPWARAITIAIIAISIGAGSMRAYSFVIKHIAHNPVAHTSSSLSAIHSNPTKASVLSSKTTASQGHSTSAVANGKGNNQASSNENNVKAAATPPRNSATAALHANANSAVQQKASLSRPVSVVAPVVKQVVKPATHTLGKLGL